MRVVAGRCRGLRLVAPDGDETRPTSDRAREAVFNSLWSLGVLDDARVADLYCGSGAMGIEALSRGAGSAVFVDRSRGALDAVGTNLATCALRDDATLVHGDVLAELRGRLGASAFDLVFIDPPYAFDDWAELLALVRADVVVIESDRAIEPGPGWEVLRQRRYGGTVVTIARDAGPDRTVRTGSEE